MTSIFERPGTSPPNPFSTLIQQALTSSEPSTQNTLAAHIISTVTASPNPSTSLWSLWDAFFIAIATVSPPTSSNSFTPHLNLLSAFRTHRPTKPANITPGSDAQLQLRNLTGAEEGTLNWSTLPRFSAQWRDMHDILEAWRDWDGMRKGDEESNHSPDQYFLRFIRFSAILLREAHERRETYLACPIWVFYACKNVLEKRDDSLSRSGKPTKAHRMSSGQLRELDIRVTATWVREGARALWETDGEELRKHWTAALDEETESWPRRDGLTRERWELWGKRLHGMSEEDGLGEETSSVAREAAEVVEGLLRGV